MSNLPLILSQIRIHGVGEVIDSVWIDIGNKLTTFVLPDDFRRSGFLRALQTINPPYEIKSVQPFCDYPLIIRQGKYQKRVRPDRRTIAFAIYTAEPELVLRLSDITPNLYETDRIEVGRRMDYSRWINFVEIASSTRWSEVSGMILDLQKRYPTSYGEHLNTLVGQLKKTDRLKNGIRETIDSWLRELLAIATKNSVKEDILDTRFLVQRQIYFNQAKEVIKGCLPKFYIIDLEHLNQDPLLDRELPEIDKIIQHIKRIITQEENKGNTTPVLLIDEPGLGLGQNNREVFREYVLDLTEKCQCLYLQTGTLAREREEGGKIVTLEDMLPHKKTA